VLSRCGDEVKFDSRGGVCIIALTCFTLDATRREVDKQVSLCLCVRGGLLSLVCADQSAMIERPDV